MGRTGASVKRRQHPRPGTRERRRLSACLSRHRVSAHPSRRPL